MSNRELQLKKYVKMEEKERRKRELKRIIRRLKINSKVYDYPKLIIEIIIESLRYSIYCVVTCVMFISLTSFNWRKDTDIAKDLLRKNMIHNIQDIQKEEEVESPEKETEQRPSFIYEDFKNTQVEEMLEDTQDLIRQIELGNISVEEKIKENLTQIDQIKEEFTNVDIHNDKYTQIKEDAQETIYIYHNIYDIVEEKLDIDMNMDVSKPTDLTKKEFQILMSRLKKDISDYFSRNASYIWEYCHEQDVNEMFVVGIKATESYWGQDKKAQRTNNYSGILNSDGSLKHYETEEQEIQELVNNLAQNYLKPEGKYYNGSTIHGVNTEYCKESAIPGDQFHWTLTVYSRMKEAIGQE